MIGIKQFYAPYNEADDTIATLLKNTPKSVLIFTVDKDIMQLTSDFQNHHILCGNKILKEQDIIDKFGVYPYQIPDYLALVGDTADNINGIKGIGKKKAQNILKEHGSIIAISENPSDFKSEKDLEKAKVNRKLTLLNFDANVQLLFDKTSPMNSIDDILNKYELTVLRKRKKELLNIVEEKE